MSYVQLSSCICCSHKYQAIWKRNRLFQKIDNTNDPNVVRIMKEERLWAMYVYLIKFQDALLLELVDISSVHAVTGDRHYSPDPSI